MMAKTQDTEFRHPETVAYLQSLTDQEAKKHPAIFREHDGVVTRYWRDGKRIRCREMKAEEAASERDALRAAAETEFGRLLPRMNAEFGGDGVTDLDTIETSVREGLLGCGARIYAATLEALDAELPSPSCPKCNEPMKRHSKAVKTLQTRLGPIRIKRNYFRCLECGVGFHPLDRALDLEGKSVTPGAESIYADTVGSDSYEEASRKLRNLVGVDVPKSALQRHGMRTGQKMRELEEKDVEAEPTSGSRAGAGRRHRSSGARTRG